MPLCNSVDVMDEALPFILEVQSSSTLGSPGKHTDIHMYTHSWLVGVVGDVLAG